MAKGRDFFTQIGITKKDRKEMAGCMVAMIFIPIYLLVDGAKILCNIVTSTANFIEKSNKKKNIKKNNSVKKSQNQQIKFIKSDFEIVNKEKKDALQKTFVENKYISIEYWINFQQDGTLFVIAYSHLKFKNGQGLNNSFNNMEKIIFPDNYFTDDDLIKIVSEKVFSLAKKYYENSTNKKYYFDDNELFNIKRH